MLQIVLSRGPSQSLFKRYVSQIVTVGRILVPLIGDSNICEVWGKRLKGSLIQSFKCLKVINQCNKLLNKTIYSPTLANKSSLCKFQNMCIYFIWLIVCQISKATKFNYYRVLFWVVCY